MTALNAALICCAVIAAGESSSTGTNSSCLKLPDEPNRKIECLLPNGDADCSRELVPGTVLRFECRNYYKLEPDDVTVSCLYDGSWSSGLPTCKPDCGKSNTALTLIVNGIVATPGMYPWQVSIYNLIDNKYEFWCGGSLISEYSVITAAHCTWKISRSNLILAFGKFYRDYYHDEDNAQIIKVRNIEILESYQDIEANYNGDLSIMFLKTRVTFTTTIKPICLDWEQQFMDEQLAEGKRGVVLGWGLTESDAFSDILRTATLPVMSDRECLKQLRHDFKKYVTYTSFCAGYRNGTGVCNGDSGGGLAFLDKASDTWYLQGIVSVSPRRYGTPYCDSNYYAVFTKVSMFTKWLRKMKEFEDEIRLKEVYSERGTRELYSVVDVMNPKWNVRLEKKQRTVLSNDSNALRDSNGCT